MNESLTLSEIKDWCIANVVDFYKTDMDTPAVFHKRIAVQRWLLYANKGRLTLALKIMIAQPEKEKRRLGHEDGVAWITNQIKENYEKLQTLNYIQAHYKFNKPTKRSRR